MKKILSKILLYSFSIILVFEFVFVGNFFLKNSISKSQASMFYAVGPERELTLFEKFSDWFMDIFLSQLTFLFVIFASILLILVSIIRKGIKITNTIIAYFGFILIYSLILKIFSEIEKSKYSLYFDNYFTIIMGNRNIFYLNFFIGIIIFLLIYGLYINNRKK